MGHCLLQIFPPILKMWDAIKGWPGVQQLQLQSYVSSYMEVPMGGDATLVYMWCQRDTNRCPCQCGKGNR